MADQQISIALPEEIIRTMQARVDAGDYNSMRDYILQSVKEHVIAHEQDELDPEYFGEDFQTYLAANRDQILRESVDWDSMIPAEQVLARLRSKRMEEVTQSAL